MFKLITIVRYKEWGSSLMVGKISDYVLIERRWMFTEDKKEAIRFM
ncbi:MAG: hypothetical protein ACXV2C_06550 [Candidatus Bathyarchaeia archaeon]